MSLAGASLALALALNEAQEVAARQPTYQNIVAEMVDESEIDLLAHLIYAEANTLGEDGMRYAGSVVLNRMSSGSYPDTLEGVIYQSGQYACTWNGGINKEPSDVAYEIAEELLIYGSVLPGEVVYQSEFTQGSGVYLKLGNTYFCWR